MGTDNPTYCTNTPAYILQQQKLLLFAFLYPPYISLFFIRKTSKNLTAYIVIIALSRELLPTPFIACFSIEVKSSSVKLINTLRIYSIAVDHNGKQLKAFCYDSKYVRISRIRTNKTLPQQQINRYFGKFTKAQHTYMMRGIRKSNHMSLLISASDKLVFESTREVLEEKKVVGQTFS